MEANATISVVAQFIEACDTVDRNTMEACLSHDVLADVTQADGSVITLAGRNAYMNAIDAMGIETVRHSITATQIAAVADDQAMAMVEIKAERKGRQLHNFAAFLMRVKAGQIERIWMVDALPEESDRFWKR